MQLVPPQLHFAHRHRCEFLQDQARSGRKLGAGFIVDDTKTSNVVTVSCTQWCTRIESNVRCSDDLRVVHEPPILRSIENNERLIGSDISCLFNVYDVYSLGKNGMTAETGDSLRLVNPKSRLRFMPLFIGVGESDEHDLRAEDELCHVSYAVKIDVFCGVKDSKAIQGFPTFHFIRRERSSKPTNVVVNVCNVLRRSCSGQLIRG